MSGLNPIALAALAGVIALAAVLGNRFQPQQAPAPAQDRIWDFRARIGALPPGPFESPPSSLQVLA